ncbi:MAG: mandelate racemase/muconate lactonizing enzyme family protein, partial [Chitinophagaceae bacterium]
MALHDCFGKLIGKSVVDFNSRQIDALPTAVTSGIADISETLMHARNYRAMGFSIFKMKTGMNVEEDIEKVIKLSEEFGRSVTLRLDANQGYSKASLVHFLSKTNEVPIELIEQPLPVGSEKELMNLADQERMKFVADESLIDQASAKQWSVDPKPFGIFNIKLMKCGGIRSSRMIADIAKQAGISLFWGCNDESICSISAALHAAYSQPHTKYIDLDGSFDLQRDVVEGGFELKNGNLLLPDQPGLGIRWR